MDDTLLLVPPANAHTVVFHFDQRAQKWDRSVYYPHMTGGRASIQEIDQVLSEIEAAYASVNSAFTKTAICFFVTLFLIGLIGTFVLDMNNMRTLQICGVILINFLFIMVATLFKISQQFRLKCQPLVDNQINQRFIPRGLRWHLPAHFPFWIELHSDYFIYQPVDMPPVAQQLVNLNNEAPQQNVGGQLYPQLPTIEPQGCNVYIPPSGC